MIEQKTARHLRALRKKQGLTLETLSERSGISKGILSRTEIGQRRITFDILEKLSKAYQFPIAALTPID